MEEMYFNPVQIVMAFGRSVIPLGIFIVSAYYLSKKTQTESILLAVGSFLTLSTSVFFNLFATSLGADFYGGGIFSIVQGLSFLGSILFAVGFVMIVLKVVRNQIDFE